MKIQIKFCVSFTVALSFVGFANSENIAAEDAPSDTIYLDCVRTELDPSFHRLWAISVGESTVYQAFPDGALHNICTSSEFAAVTCDFFGTNVIITDTNQTTVYDPVESVTTINRFSLEKTYVVRKLESNEIIVNKRAQCKIIDRPNLSRKF